MRCHQRNQKGILAEVAQAWGLNTKHGNVFKNVTRPCTQLASFLFGNTCTTVLREIDRPTSLIILQTQMELRQDNWRDTRSASVSRIGFCFVRQVISGPPGHQKRACGDTWRPLARTATCASKAGGNPFCPFWLAVNPWQHVGFRTSELPSKYSQALGLMF